MSLYTREPKCYYKKTCEIEYCLSEECPDYRPKKRGEKWNGDDDEGYLYE